jgi:hypothetical protein
VNGESQTSLWLLPGLEPHVLEGRWQLATYVDDGRIIVWVAYDDELWIFDRPDAAPRRLLRGHASHPYTAGDDIWFVAGPPPKLLRVPLDGSAPTTVASGVYAPQPLGDGRFAVLRDVPGEYDRLVVVGDGPATVIDEDVDDQLGLTNAYRLEPTQSLFYVVGPTAPDRAGLYRVAIAP